ncbi:MULTISPECIES: hypothetical protein [Polymorphospora]|uniref:Uncharacterized protein n=1 Tax=Polymorphospora lycopeni TaxID=3140240 RepID=A0ABV5D022_9ACTN
MSTDVDTRPRRRHLWIAAALAGTLVAVLATQWITRAGGSDSGDLRTQIAARMVTVLESTPAEQHGGHGAHAAGYSGSTTVCGVRIFGFEPPGATSLDMVDVVYGHHLCGIAEGRRHWDGAVKLVGPVVMRLSTDPPTIQVAEATQTATFRERVLELIPAQYQAVAFEESLDPSTMAELRKRYDDAAGF